jgi:hypothetical protein
MENDLIDRTSDSNHQGLHVGLKIVSFCIPLVGAILYFVKKNDEPQAAKDACTFAIIGLVVGIVLNVGAGLLGIGGSM